MLGGQRCLLGLILFRHFLGVTAGGFGLLELLILDREEFGPQAFDLLFHGGPHLGRGDHGANPPRRRDPLQARAPDPPPQTPPPPDCSPPARQPPTRPAPCPPP